MKKTAAKQKPITGPAMLALCRALHQDIAAVSRAVEQEARKLRDNQQCIVQAFDRLVRELNEYRDEQTRRLRVLEIVSEANQETVLALLGFLKAPGAPLAPPPPPPRRRWPFWWHR